MKVLKLAAVAVAGATLLSACSKKTETPAPVEAQAAAPAAAPASPAPASGNAMAGMDMTGAKMAEATGTVKAIDKAAGTITLDHEAIPEANWPAMTMAFKAPAAAVESAHIGDKVTAEMMIKDGAGEITKLTKK